MFLLAVIGNPIAHSLSPRIHTGFAQQCGIALSYEKILAPLNDFPKTLNDFFAKGALGCNVTAPFKQEAFAWVDTHSERALHTGAVNTIKRIDNKFFGDNTDGVGLLNDLAQKNMTLAGRKIILIGAGGATRNILPSLFQTHPRQIVLLNRDVEKAIHLCEAMQNFIPIGTSFQAASLEQLGAHLEGATLLIDATSDKTLVSSLLQPLPLPSELILYDLKYERPHGTPLVQWATAQSITAYDGIGMLIEQAAEAFYVWCGVRPETRAVLKSVIASHA